MNKSFSATLISGLLAVSGAQAQEGGQITAEYIMTELSPHEQTIYMSGVVEGLAYARYMADDQNTAGMNCIYEWFEDDRNLRLLRLGFEEWPESAPGVVVGVLVGRACP